MKFDVVIGNPPYQANQKETKGIRSGKQALWPKFVNRTMDLCNIGGYISLIHPQQWRSPDNKIFTKFKNKNLIYCEFHDSDDGIKTFGVATRYDWYILKNDSDYSFTTIKDIGGKIEKIDIREYDFLPSGNFDIIKNLMCDKNDAPQQILYSQSLYETRKNWMSSIKSDVYKYECIHSPKEDGTYSSWFSSDKSKGFFGQPKVIISKFINDSFKPPIIDADGVFGMTQVCFAIPIDNYQMGAEIKAAFMSKEFNDLVSSLKLGYFEISPKTWTLFRKNFWKEFV